MTTEQLQVLERKQTVALQQFQKFGILEVFEQAREKITETCPDAKIEVEIPDNPEVRAILRMSLDSQNDVSCRLIGDPDSPKFSFSRNSHAIVKGKTDYIVSHQTNSENGEQTITSWNIGFRAHCRRAVQAGLNAQL